MNTLAYGLLLMPPLLWATMLVVGYMVLGELPPATLTFWTWLIATFSLLPFALPSLIKKLIIVREEIIPLFISVPRINRINSIG